VTIEAGPPPTSRSPGLGSSAASASPPAPYSEPLPLTERQTHFWIERQLNPGAPGHNTMLSVELRGRLDAGALEAAYRRAVRELDGLRIFVDDALPRQWIADLEAPALEQVDLSEAPETFAEWKRARSLVPFVFPGWLFQASLVRLAHDRAVFCFLYHHIGSDAVSLLRMVDVMRAHYEGREPPAAATFREYLAYEAAYRASPKYARDTRYWADKIGKGTPPLRYYGWESSRTGVAFERVWHDAGEARKARFEAILKGPSFQLLTPSLSRLAVLSTLLFAFVHRVTEARELFIATPLENRTGRFQNTSGLLMEETFLKAEIDEGETFTSLFKKVKRDLMQSVLHGQRCVSERGVEFATMNLLTYRQGPFGGLACDVRFETAVTQRAATGEGMAAPKAVFGVQVHDVEDGDRLILGFDLHEATFPPELRRRIVAHFTRLLDAFLEDPARKIAHADLVADDERALLLAASRGPEPAATPPDLVDRIAEQAARHPDKIAVIGPDGRVTYAELVGRVNRLARRLIELGIGPEKCVAVSVPRGVAEIATLLAVLTAGGGYLPIDATQPAERLQMILEDAAPSLLVTRAGALAFLKTDVERLILDDEAPDSRIHVARPKVPLSGAELAYVLFTSGSTGRPKGVEIPRKALWNFLASMEREPGLTAQDRLLAITTTMFDIAGLELYLPLWVGATVQIADHDTAVDARLLRAVLERDPVTLLQATPSTWRSLIDVGWTGDGRLKMLCGGEALSPDLADKLLERGGELWNMYGPTETTVWSTLARVQRGGVLVVGRPIDRTQVYVLDAGAHLVPAGVTGEICIGGAGLARGYRGRPDLTAARFVRFDQGGHDGERIYRTGDLGRLLDSGELECRGRIDHQIKIRGHRIELGEIESVLRKVDGVADVVVVPQPSPTGDPRLVAYYSGHVERSALTERARAALPQYLQPSVLMQLPALPLNTNGKVDRKALPEPPQGETFERDYVPPQTGVERELCRIWEAALAVDEVGITDDFFELGGHSLLAVKVCDQIHESFAVELPLAVFFEAPTVELLARRITTYQMSGDGSPSTWTSVVPFHVGGSLPPVFCVAGLGGEVMNLRHLAHAFGPDQPFYGLQHRGVDGRLRPHWTVQDMAREFLDDVRRVQPRGPYYLAGHSAGGLAAFEMAAMLEAQREQVGLVMLLDTLSPTAPRWSAQERLEAHYENLAQHGARYLVGRLVERSMRRARELRQRVGARLAAFSPFRFRHNAIVEAAIAAEGAYRPATVRGPVALLQADSRLTAGKGIGYKPHESNGWRDHVRGKLLVVPVACSHLDIVGDENAPQVAMELRKVLAAAYADTMRRRSKHPSSLRAGSGGPGSVRPASIRPGSMAPPPPGRPSSFPPASVRPGSIPPPSVRPGSIPPPSLRSSSIPLPPLRLDALPPSLRSSSIPPPPRGPSSLPPPPPGRPSSFPPPTLRIPKRSS
jgi:amino acid adenylation domain-containing protein